jgi:predicted Zn-dependent protease
MAILDQLAPQGGSHGPELEADVSFAMDDLAATLKDKDLAARAGARMRAFLDKGSSSMTPGQRFLLCEAARRLGDAPAARKWLETVVADDPENGAARNNLAVLLLESDANPARALALARQASWLDPGNPLRMETLAVALYRSGSHEEGIRLLRRCVDLDPKRVIWAINLARWLGDAGRFAEAKLQLERARTYSGDMAKLIDTQLDLMHRGTLVPTSRPTVGP